MASLISPYELDVVIPVYNEADNILPVLESLHRHVSAPFRVLICYDRDDDTTLPVVKEFARDRFAQSVPAGSVASLAGAAADAPVDEPTVGRESHILLVKNHGHGPHAAVLTGFAHSRAPAVLVFCADDCQNAPTVESMLQRLRAGCDLVAASRFMDGGSMEGCPPVKNMLVRTASFTLYHLARLPIHDATNGLRMFSRRVIEQIPIQSSKGFTFSIELAVKCHRLGWPMEEVPSRWVERTRGQSRFRVFRWLLPYLRWYLYAFGTTWLRRRRVAGMTTPPCIGESR